MFCINDMGSWVSIFCFCFFFLKHGKEPESFIFCGIKDQIFGDKKDIVSVPYLTVIGFLACNLLHTLKSYGIVSWTLKVDSRVT